MNKTLRIVKKTIKEHRCIYCKKWFAKGSTAWCLILESEEGKSFYFFHNKECYDNFEAERR